MAVRGRPREERGVRLGVMPIPGIGLAQGDVADLRLILALGDRRGGDGDRYGGVPRSGKLRQTSLPRT
jgi:hypothetical protein